MFTYVLFIILVVCISHDAYVPALVLSRLLETTLDLFTLWLG